MRFFSFFTRSNFLGTKFVVYDALPPHMGAKLAKNRSTRMFSTKQIFPGVPASNYPVAHISYELNVMGARYEEDLCYSCCLVSVELRWYKL